MHTNRGFSLIELLIVVAIILIIAAIAIPGLLGSKIAANESAAVSALRTLNTAQNTYIVSYPEEGYADALNKLGPPPDGQKPSAEAAGLVDNVLGCAAEACVKSGYRFSIVDKSGDPVNSYRIIAVPQLKGQTGNRGFCIGNKMEITFDPAGGSDCTSVLQ